MIMGIAIPLALFFSTAFVIASVAFSFRKKKDSGNTSKKMGHFNQNDPL